MKNRNWTEKEREWKAKLENDQVYEIIPMSTLYNSLPEPTAFDVIAERFPGADRLGPWCTLIMIHQMVEMMLDSVVIVHGTLNCTSCIRNFHSHLFHQWGHGFIHTPTTAIDKRQVVFGGENELYEAIKAVDRDYRPKLIVILSGCATGLVQDDIIRVAEQAQAEVAAKLFPYTVTGYEITNLGLIIETVTQMWIDLMDQPVTTDKSAVNILGNAREIYWLHARGCRGSRPYPYPSDSDILGGYIEELGLKVHRVLMGGDYDYVRTASEAALNTVICGTWGFPLAERMKQKFGMPYLREELPLGIEATTRWIKGLAELTGRELQAEKLIKRECAAINDTWRRCKEMVAGKTIILGGAGNRAASYLRLCKELGMEVIYIPAYPDMGSCLDEAIKGKRVDWEYFLDYGFDPLVLRLREGVPRSYKLYYLPMLMEKLGLSEDDVIYMYCDFSAYSGTIEPSRIPYVSTSTHLRRRPGYPSRAVGFSGTKGLCLDIMEAVKIANRKTSPTLYTRIYQR